MTKLRKPPSLTYQYRSYFININDVLLLDNIVYLDREMCVLVNINHDKVLTYYKRTAAGLHKICELRVPDSGSLTETSYSFSGPSETESSSDWFELTIGDNLSDDSVSDHDWTEEYRVTNWAKEIVDTGAVEIPEWATIEGLDFNRKTEYEEEMEFEEEVCQEPTAISNFAAIPNNSFEDKGENRHDYMVLDWAAEEMCDEEVDVPEWAKIPNFKFMNVAEDQRYQKSYEEAHQYVANWAEEEWNEIQSDIPDWAYVPNFSFRNYDPTTSKCDEPEYSEYTTNGWDNTASSATSQALKHTEDECAYTNFDSDPVYTNRKRINKKTFFVEEIFGLATVWE